ncbi:MAG: methylated-DNA--[protein]-cysteine S-methyltransferase [Acidobacteriota bacterium]|nr:methylated-DNA--[protein]-cysteine S-methyltransferase [Acidobacteriota bacterium]
MYYDFMETEKGPLIIAADEEGIHHIDFQDGKRPLTVPDQWQRYESDLIKRAKQQLCAYFNGELTRFDLPLKPQGTTFQRGVWEQLCKIPSGRTISYAELAEAVGKPTASRAVGAANGQNPISIVIPCHRVIGKNGKLTGYAGGLDVKAWLLDHEHSVAIRSQ